MKASEIGKINPSLFIMAYRKWNIYKIEPGLHVYEKVTAAETIRGYLVFGNAEDSNGFLMTVEQIDAIEDGGK